MISCIFTYEKRWADDPDETTVRTGTLDQLEVFLPDPIVDFIDHYCPLGNDQFALHYIMDDYKVSIIKHTK